MQSDEGPLDLPADWKAQLTAFGDVGISVAPVLALLDATTLRAQQSAIRSMGTPRSATLVSARAHPRIGSHFDTHLDAFRNNRPLAVRTS